MINRLRVVLACLLLLMLAPQTQAGVRGGGAAPSVTITNYNGVGITGSGVPNQVTHFDTSGNQIDAHSGSILQVGTTFYMYGETYGCGFQYYSSPGTYCGVKVYSSTDLVNWSYIGLLFDPTTTYWQTQCATTGCFRAKVIYNAANNNYVVWLNQGSYNSSAAPDQYFVFTCTTPFGGCTQQASPSHLHNAGGCTAPVCNGDEGLFVDPTTNIGYVIYNNDNHGIEIDQLNSSYTDSTGSSVVVPSSTNSESPFMFYANGYYFAGFGPDCPYCSSTATNVESATSPLGTYGNEITLNSTSCNGQAIEIDALTTSIGPQYVYRSDQWNTLNNESLAPIYWQSVSVVGNSVAPFSCNATVSISGLSAAGQTPPTTPSGSDQSDFKDGYTAYGGAVNSSYWRMQTFVPTSSTLSKIEIPLVEQYSGGTLNANPTVELVSLDGSNNPVSVLATKSIPTSSLSYDFQTITVTFNYSGLTPNTPYGIVIGSSASQGTVGVMLWDNSPNSYPAGVERYSANSGSTWTSESNRSIMFSTFP